MTFMWIAIAVLFVLGIAVSVCLVRFSQRLSITEQRFSDQLNKLQHELGVINSAAIAVGQRLINTEKKLKSAMEKQQNLDAASSEHFPFNQAASLIKAGAGAAQLVESCGLSDAEAQLMTLMQARKENTE
jgi:cell division protein ZapA (FtsZ GTPase activity inhibitor)